MVKAVAFESFLRAMEGKGEEENVSGIKGAYITQFLPFSCWCDGGSYENARHRQHRHMIAVVSKDRCFQREVWRKVGITKDRPSKNYPSKGMKRIVSPMHLVNTIGYLSQRLSSCEFLSNKNKKYPPTEKHFYIFTTLPVEYKLPLAVLWETGLAELMYQELFQNVSVESVIKYPLNRVHSQWRQKIDDFYALPRGLVLPVDRKLVPTTERDISHRYIYLLNGRKIHFEALSEPLDPKTWLEKQVQGGNCLYDSIGDQWWIPRKDDQEKLNLVIPREYQIKDLTVENSHLKRNNEALIEENRQLNHKIQELYEGEIKRFKSSS